MLQVIPCLYAQYQETSFSFLQLHTKTILWAESGAMPTTMPRCAFYSIADFTIFCWVALKSCYRIWTHYVSDINPSTVFLHSSSIDSLEILLSRAAKCLFLCKQQTVSIINQRNRGVAKCPASQKRLLKEKYRKHSLSSFQRRKSIETSGLFFSETKQEVRKER